MKNVVVASCCALSVFLLFPGNARALAEKAIQTALKKRP